ncbi:MAG: hypothetical protein ACKV2T_35240 [Kofleriaceae bacterium]
MHRALLAASFALALPAHANDCPPEHAAQGHCTPVPDPPASTSDAKCTPAHAAMGHCRLSIGSSTPANTGRRVGITTKVGTVAATYQGQLFEGDYQGVKVGAGVSYGRYSLSADLVTYRLDRNGRASNGIGDLMIHAHATLVSRGTLSGGAMLMVSAPTGDDARGFGMGHVMLMPELFGSWSNGRFVVDALAGFAYATGGATAHAEHGGGGAWPLVDPMNAQELTFGVRPTYMVTSMLGVGASGHGAVPISDGVSRLVAGGHVLWIAGRFATSFEIAGGVAGDPFGLRGLLTTTIRVR